jgi:hypothetical protein
MDMNCQVFSKVSLSQAETLLEPIQEEKGGTQTCPEVMAMRKSLPLQGIESRSSSQYPATILPELHRLIYWNITYANILWRCELDKSGSESWGGVWIWYHCQWNFWFCYQRVALVEVFLPTLWTIRRIIRNLGFYISRSNFHSISFMP